MAVTSQQIIDFLTSNPGMSDAEIVAAMEQYGVSPAQMAQAVGLDEGAVAARVGAAIPPNQAVLLGDTYVQAVNQTTGSGENEQVGGLENVITYKASENKVGGNINYYSPTGEYQQTTQQQKVDTSLGGALKDIVSNPGFKIIAAAYGLDAALSAFGATGATFAGEALADAGLLSGTGAGSAFEALNAGAGAGADYLGGSLANVGTAGTIGNTGLTLSELTQLDMSLGGSGGTLGALTLAEQLGGLAAGTLTGSLLTSGAGAGTAANLVGGAAATSLLGGGGAATTLGGAATNLGGAASTLLKGAGSSVVNSLLGGAGTAVVNKLTGGTSTNVGNLISGGLTTAGSLLQQQASKDAALRAQAMIDAETAAAKQASQFRPVGMTTRFGTSQFGYDPVTGQMTSAGYTLDPQAKNAQDRLVKLAESGLQQAEGAQAQFAPLQTGAQGLFNLGNQYISQSPQSVAENYLKQQMALLQPGREIELANLQNRLQQQGRGGLSVAQGGTMGATTPELQALYNARAQQEAVLAANAQQAGQQQVLYGAGLLGQGANAMGSYYGGQQQAYSPYTNALGQVQNLETLGQQPFNMSNALAQQTSTAGARQGQLGLAGAQLSTNLATSANATANPYAQALMAAGNPNAMFGQSLNNVFSGLFGSGAPVNALSSAAYGPGNAGFQNMLNDIYG
jgi:hypothetical protein